MNLRRYLPSLGVLLLFVVLTLAATFPLITEFTTHVPGRAIDDPAFVWNIWWVRHALLDLHTSPLSSDYIFYPLGISLVFYTLTLLNGIIAIPLLAFTGAITATNILLVAQVAFSGWGVYLLVLYLLGNSKSNDWHRRLAAVAAGIVYAFYAGRWVYAAFGQFNFVSTAWIPFFVLFLLKTFREQAPRRTIIYAILAGVCMAAATLTELTYGAFLAIFLAFYLLRVVLGKNLRMLANAALRLVVLVATFALLASPMLLAVYDETRTEGDYAGSQWGGADIYSGDLLGFFVPSHLHPIFGQTASRIASHWTDYNIVFVGYVTLTLALLGAIVYWNRAATRRPPLVRWWAFSALAYAIFCLGPLMHINGVDEWDLDGLLLNIPLPGMILHYIPLIKATRIPNRFTILLMLCIGVLVGYGVYWLLGKLRTSRPADLALVSVALCSLILFEHWSAPLPLANMSPSPVYAALAAVPGDFSVLDLPLGWRNSYGVLGEERTTLQAYQTVHGKRLLSGNTSRNPDWKFDYFKRAPLLASLQAIETGKPVDDAQRESDKRIAPEVLRFYNIRYVIVHSEVEPPLDPKVLAALGDYVRAVMPVQEWQRDPQRGVVIYKVVLPPEQTAALGTGGTGNEVMLDWGTGASGIYQISGWSYPEKQAGDIRMSWSDGAESRMMARLPSGGAYRMTVRAMPFAYQGSPQQEIVAYFNNVKIGQVKVAGGWENYTFDIPAGLARPGINELRFTYAYTAQPKTIFPGSTDERHLAVGVDYIVFNPE